MAVSVREATRDDLPGILQRLSELPVTTGEGESFELEESRAASMFERILGQEGRTMLVAVDGGEVVGTLDLLVAPNLTHDASPWAMIENLEFPSESPQIGKALLEEAIGRAQAAGCYKVQLMSFKERTKANELYRSTGFEPLAEGFRIYF